ncbi:Fe superoxide dismutase-like protein [Massarina eburnea CBS 473.64]|uniref:Fe superoxide dismutase-like protein n=1 Tax=Massarina eburnea CBS 473.64 TaxID=1395130 RepID=A0A6A6SEW6_9PLEO|nr:Fe superoxide dismutase-like protein [Massarina eburnea CBS 473.64]
MIIRSLARRSHAFQCLAPAARCRAAPPALFARSLHNVATLDNHVELQTSGIPGLLTAKGFDTAYLQYQKLITDELNYMTSGMTLENLDAKSLTIETARDPARAYIFNLASMAFNNHFFFKNINTNRDITSTPPADLVHEINNHFVSMDTFKETFLGTADAMFGPGFVWLVQLNDTVRKELRILSTYAAGSPLSGAHYRRQETDMNTQNPDSYRSLNPVGAFGKAAHVEQQPKKPLGGVELTPLLCVNTWEHVWLHDYGIRGKSQYLEAWWDRVDWNRVNDMRSISTPQKKSEQMKFAY